MTTSQAASSVASGNPAPKPPGRPRGFAAMSPERVREISRLGGKAAHQKGVAHEFTREEAQAAGRKGGLAAHQHDANRAEGAQSPQEPAPESSDSQREGEGQAEATSSKEA